MRRGSANPPGPGDHSTPVNSTRTIFTETLTVLERWAQALTVLHSQGYRLAEHSLDLKTAEISFSS